MNIEKRKIEQILRDFGLNIALVLGGLILLLNPDGATALVTKLIGWVCVVVGAAMLIRPALKNIHISGGTWVWGGAMIALGVLLLAKPMIMADSLGRFFGILLLIEGFRTLRGSGLRILTILTIVGGLVLIAVPRTLTQTLLGACGIVMIIIGAVNILGRVSENRRLDEGSDPNIIDAEP